MASLLNRVLGVVGRAALDAVGNGVRSRASTSRSAPGRPGRTGSAATTGTRAGTDDSSRSGGTRRDTPHGGAPSAERDEAPDSRNQSQAVGSSRGVTVYDVASRGLPAFSYSPDPDGDADPGEVVWTWVPYEEDPSQGKDRPVLVLAPAHDGGKRLVIAQMTSKDHDRDAAQEAHWGRYWHDVGSGPWDSRRRASEVRLDRLLLVEPTAVRREGATMDRATFDGVVAALREHWS